MIDAPFVVDYSIDYPISLADAKLYCRVDHSEEDELISGLIASAADYIEEETGLTIGIKEKEIKVYNPQYLGFGFYTSPILSIVSCSYKDIGKNSQNVSSSVFSIRKTTWPNVITYDQDYIMPSAYDGFDFRFSCGFDEETIPSGLRQLYLFMISTWYSNREYLVDKKMGLIPHFDCMLAKYRLTRW